MNKVVWVVQRMDTWKIVRIYANQEDAERYVNIGLREYEVGNLAVCWWEVR